MLNSAFTVSTRFQPLNHCSKLKQQYLDPVLSVKVWTLTYDTHIWRKHRSKNKNAQEGHGAITPVSPHRVPAAVLPSVQSRPRVQALPSSLTSSQERLYDLIWRRTLACQMAPARLQQV